MAKLSDTQVYGSLTADTSLIAGAGSGFSNMVVYISGASTLYSFPAALRVPGAKLRVTLVGGGGGGAGSSAGVGTVSGAGASGAVCVINLNVVDNIYAFTYTIGVAGTAGAAGGTGGTGGNSTLNYNSVTYTAAGGVGGSLSTSFTFSTGGVATNGTLNLQGGYGGGGGTFAANNSFSYTPWGGDTPLGLGQGGDFANNSFVSQRVGSGYGAGSGGAYGVTATAVGTIGTPGLLIIEY